MDWDMDFGWLLYPSPGNYLTVYYDQVLDSPVTIKLNISRLLDLPDTSITAVIPAGYKRLGHKEYTPHDRIRNAYSKYLGNNYHMRAIVPQVTFHDVKKYALSIFPLDNNQLDYKTSISFVSNGENINYTDYTTYTYHHKGSYFSDGYFQFLEMPLTIEYDPKGEFNTGQQLKLLYFTFVSKGKQYTANTHSGATIDIKLMITRKDKENFDADFSGKCWDLDYPNPDTLYITDGKIIKAKLPE